MPNSYGYNADLNIDGDSMNDWQTGSSNVTMKLFVRDVLGICPEYDGVVIRPAAKGPFDGVEGKVLVRGKPLTVKIRRTAGDKARFFLDGVEQVCEFDEMLQTWSLFIPNDKIEKGASVIAELPR